MKNRKKALCLFLALSMLLTVCTVDILAEDTITLTVPNGNFANTCDANGALPDGWTAKLVAATAFASNRQYTISSAFANSNAEGAPSSDGSYSLELLDTSTGGLLVESPKILLGNALTEKKEFTVNVDYKSGNAGQTIGAAVNFYNAEGKVYNNGEWIEELTSETMTQMTSWCLKDAEQKDSFIRFQIVTTNKWVNTGITATAPIDTASVSVSLVAATGGALRVYYDNVTISYKSIASVAGLQPVTNLTASAGDRQVTLSWDLPTDTTNYAGVKIAVKNGATPVKEIFVEDTAKTSETIEQLENGVDYTFEVYAMNADKSTFSEAVSVNAVPVAATAGSVEIPNWNFENTVAENQPLTDGWSYQLYVNPDDALGSGMLYYAIYAKSGNGKSASGSNSLEMKCPGTSGGYNKTAIIVKSPIVSLTEALTAKHQFTYDFDYKCIAGNFNTAILFHNAEGKVYNGTEWIDFAVNKDEDWKFTDSSGQNGYSTIGITAANKQWSSSQIVTNAPAGTTGVSVIVIATGSGANKFAIDNLKITYVPAPEEKPVPKPITALEAESGDGQVTLNWTKPENDPNYAGVQVTVKNGADTIKTVDFTGADTQTGTVNGLTNGTEYTFEVKSTNADKTLLSEAAVIKATPFAQGQVVEMPVKNAIADRTIYADDYEMSIDLNILPAEGDTFTEDIKTIAEKVNVFDKLDTELEFSSDTEGVTFRTVLYDEKAGVVIRKQQLVYKPSAVGAYTVQLKANTKDGVFEGETSFQVTVSAAPENEKPANDPNSDTQFLYVPNAGFERWPGGVTPTEYNQDLSGGWHPILWGKADGYRGNDQLCYRSVGGSSGNGLDIKVPSGNTRGYMMLQSALIPTPDTKARAYTFGFMYKQNAARNSGAMFFYNEKKELFMGYDGEQNPIWKAEPVGEDFWNSKDAGGLKAYESFAKQDLFSAGSMTRTAPEGTAFVTVAFPVVGNSAYRIYVDEATLSYQKVQKVRPISGLKTTSGDGQVTLNWTKPAGDKLYAGVRITVKNGSSVVKTVDVEGADKETVTITELTNNVNYTFEVQSMTADKTEFAEAVSVTEIPHIVGVLPVKNPIGDKRIYSDDYEMTVDLNIVDEGTASMSAEQQAYYDSVVGRTNVFESKGKKLNFTSDTPGVSFREMKYGLGLDPLGSKVQNVIKQQLVYQPSQNTQQPITVNVTADDGAGSTGTVSFQLTVVAPPESEKPVDDPISETAQLYVPNADFDRTSELLPYNRDLSGGWHPILWGNADGRLGDNQLSYVGVAGKDGNGLDLKAPSGGGTNLMIQSAFIETPDAQERAYSLNLVYKCGNSVQRPNFSMFFFNEKKEGFLGFDGDGAAVWKADPTAAELWASVDAEGKAPYENAGSTSGFQPFSLTRTAPEGTSYVVIALNATFGSAYRYQVDNIRLTYLKNGAPVVNGENPLNQTISLGEILQIDLNKVFSEPEGEEMTFTAEAGKGTIENGVYSYVPNKIGTETVSVTASDPHGAKTRLKINLTVNDTVSTSVPNKDIKPVTRAVVNGSAALQKADGSEVTSLSQLSAGDTLKINVRLKNTSELPITATLLIVKYDDGGVTESVTTKVIVIPATDGEPDYTTVRDYVVDNNSGSVEVMLWDSATNLNSLIDPIRI